MPHDSKRYQRRSIRLPGYDYTRPGAYFVTVCIHRGEPVLGEIKRGVMHLNDWGRVVETCWRAIPQHFPHAKLDAFVVMPNHVHGIICILGDNVVGAQPPAGAPLQTAPPRTPSHPHVKPGSLGAIVRSFKSAATKRINEIRGTPGARFWQRNYHERIIRHDRMMHAVRQYILQNPQRWTLDRQHPSRRGRER